MFKKRIQGSVFERKTDDQLIVKRPFRDSKKRVDRRDLW